MSRLQFAETAQRDLDELWLFIAADDPQAADRFVDEVKESCGLLLAAPRAGRERSDLAVGLREFLIGDYLILYYPRDYGVEVVRVVSDHRDLPTLFGV
jgi:toxin ParE1/3/4